MDIRNVQKTGNMYYVYLPTSWARKYNIKANAKVGVAVGSDGSLMISHHLTEKKGTHLNIDLNEDDQSIINKVLVASYINPTSSFKINLMKPIDIEKLLDQKKLISIEMVEFDGKHISCESSIAVEDPILLLKTMARKVKNMLGVMRRNADKQLMEIYEDEIDRSKLLIEKSVISRLTFHEQSSIRTVYLHYTALISKDLEKAVDQLSSLAEMSGSSEKAFIDSFEKCVTLLIQILEKLSSGSMEIDYKDIIAFSKQVDAIRAASVTNMQSYTKWQTKQLLSNISEVLFDWSISHLVEEKSEKAEISITTRATK